MLRVSSTKAFCRAAAAGFLLSAAGWSQAPARADPTNRIGVGRPEWGGETRDEHAARMAADQKAHPTLAIGAPIKVRCERSQTGGPHSRRATDRVFPYETMKGEAHTT